MEYTIQALSLTKIYDGNTALNELSISIKKGEIFCLLGQNGAGKTTTLNILMGFVEATSGIALINGTEVRQNLVEARRQMAYIPEVVQLYGYLNGLENLDYFSRLAGYRLTSAHLRSLLLKAGLQQEAHHQRLSTYSKGMRQKVGIAIAIAKNAEVILMDEPTSGLDPKAISDFSATCRELADAGKTIMMATHDLFNAVNLGARIGIMRRGELVKTLPADQVTVNELQELYLSTI